MSHYKNILLSISISLLFCNQIDAMKRARQEEIQEMIVIAPVVQAPDYHFAQAAQLPSVPQKVYWDGKSPYNGSMIIKARLDHHCKHCKETITNESSVAHIFKHPDVYDLRSQKKLRIEDPIESSRLSGVISCEESSSNSSEDRGDNKPRFVEKTCKKESTVNVFFCDEKGCKFSTNLLKKMNNHTRLHGVKNCSVCEICHYRAIYSTAFQNHLQTHLPKEERSNTAKCEPCDKVFSKLSSLKRHMKNQHSL